MTKPRVLFLCTGNSARSQMAEGLLRHLASDRFEAVSAGTEPAGLNPLAVDVMREKGIDISAHRSKSAAELLDQSFPFVVTVCAQAEERCPVFPGAIHRLHWPFDDPAAAEGTREQRLAAFRRVRDEIERRIEDFVAERTT